MRQMWKTLQGQATSAFLVESKYKRQSAGVRRVRLSIRIPNARQLVLSVVG